MPFNKIFVVIKTTTNIPAAKILILPDTEQESRPAVPGLIAAIFLKLYQYTCNFF
jgi:hypothetical protein